jgi:hypothetical protein
MAHGDFGRRRRWRNAPNGDVMAPTPVRRPGGYYEPFLMRSSSTGAAQDGDSPKVVLG